MAGTEARDKIEKESRNALGDLVLKFEEETLKVMKRIAFALERANEEARGDRSTAMFLSQMEKRIIVLEKKAIYGSCGL